MIRAAKLVRTFGSCQALRGIDLTIDKGELFALIGPDGAGKSTLFRIVAGLLEADSGTVRIAENVAFGFVPQRFSLYEDLSIDENLELRARLYDIPDDVAAQAREGSAGSASASTASEASRGSALGRHEAEARARLGAHRRSRRSFSSTSRRRRRPGLAPRVLAAPQRAAPRGPDDRRLDAVHGRGRVRHASRVPRRGRLSALGTRDEILASYPRPLVEVRSSKRVEVQKRLDSVQEVDDISLFGTRLHVSGKRRERQREEPGIS